MWDSTQLSSLTCSAVLFGSNFNINITSTWFLNIFSAEISFYNIAPA